MFPYNYPYANFHELNLDWILERLKEQQAELVRIGSVNSEEGFYKAVEKAAKNGVINSAIEGAVLGLATVKTFGAVGDGEHDDIEAFRASLNEQNCVILTPGVYRVSAPIVLEDDRSIIGLSASTCVIRGVFDGPVIASAGFPDVQKKNIAIRNVSVRGDDSYTMGGNTGVAVNSAGITLNNVEVIAVGGRGFHLRGSGDQTGRFTHVEGSIFNCSAIGCGYDGIFFEGPNDTTMTDCQFISNGQAENAAAAGAANAYISSSIKVIGCHFWNFSAGSGYYKAANGVLVNGASAEFSDCHFEGSAQNNIIMVGGNVLISNSRVYAPASGAATMISNQGGVLKIANSVLTGADGLYCAITNRGHCALVGVTISAPIGIDSADTPVIWIGDYSGGSTPFIGSSDFNTFLTGAFDGVTYPKFNPPE